MLLLLKRRLIMDRGLAGDGNGSRDPPWLKGEAAQGFPPAGKHDLVRQVGEVHAHFTFRLLLLVTVLDTLLSQWYLDGGRGSRRRLQWKVQSDRANPRAFPRSSRRGTGAWSRNRFQTHPRESACAAS
jgi:hypothetical protein